MGRTSKGRELRAAKQVADILSRKEPPVTWTLLEGNYNYSTMPLYPPRVPRPAPPPAIYPRRNPGRR